VVAGHWIAVVHELGSVVIFLCEDGDLVGKDLPIQIPIFLASHADVDLLQVLWQETESAGGASQCFARILLGCEDCWPQQPKPRLADEAYRHQHQKQQQQQ
jgi:hypothetical protein